MGIIIVRIFMLAAAAAAGLAFGPPLGLHAPTWWLAGAGFLFGRASSHVNHCNAMGI